ncbi:hypothetical protein [Planotetraspora kaengkrachanensis]|uniref:Uncharacterized protein n=1 Tax=Planotetraspora kaengkrachanensis TaxID=575193 RepID=A0A8J3LYL1_9ACTN|nr:hypothetical protein [Planotetraspora kaengkrachanensis]GIG78808.1 hypothetical protein Pka01_19350 [Planotetraspora kaengkrachanensis]
MKKTLLRRFRALLEEPVGHPADGRMIGAGLAAAMRRQGSADDVERYLEAWAGDRRIDASR